MDLDAIRNQVLSRVGENSANNLRFANTPQGHGFIAEEMNHFIDSLNAMKSFNLSGSTRPKIIGYEKDHITGKIIKHGADRFYNGSFIQSKFHKNARSCISSCLDNKGNYIYTMEGGGYQKLEVPKGQGKLIKEGFKNLVKTGKIRNVKDPSIFDEIVVESIFEYDQIKKSSEFFTPESLCYDAISGCFILGASITISGLMSFAIAIWSGVDTDEAMSNAIDIALKVGGITFATHMISSQISRTSLNQSLKSASTELVNSQTFKKLTHGIRNTNGIGSSKSISNHIANKGIAAISTIAVLSVIELTKFLSSRISGAQAFKNIVIQAVSVAASIAGTKAGVIAGAKVGLSSLNPWVVLVSAIAGGIAGFMAGMATKSIMDNFIEDDAVTMLRIFEKAIADLATDYLLGNEEIQEVISSIKENQDIPQFLAFMYYAEKNTKSAYSVAYVISEHEMENVISKRGRINLTDNLDCSIIENKLVGIITL